MDLTRCTLDPLLLPSTPLLLAALRTCLLDTAPTGALGLDATLSLLRDAIAADAGRFVVMIQRAERMRDCWEEHVQEAIWGLAELVSLLLSL